jgi:hypothetical protein
VKDLRAVVEGGNLLSAIYLTFPLYEILPIPQSCWVANETNNTVSTEGSRD